MCEDSDAGYGVEAEEHDGDNGHDEDVDIETLDEEPEQAQQEEGDGETTVLASEEPQPTQTETQVLMQFSSLLSFHGSHWPAAVCAAEHAAFWMDPRACLAGAHVVLQLYSLPSCCSTQEKTAAEEVKAPAEPGTAAAKADEKTRDGNQASDDAAPKQSPGPSPAVSSGTPTRPTDTPAVSSQQQGKTKPKVYICHLLMGGTNPWHSRAFTVTCSPEGGRAYCDTAY